MPTKAVHVVPMLSPVLEDFVPPQFRGNIPDTPKPGEAAAAPGADSAPGGNFWFGKINGASGLVPGENQGEEGVERTGIRSRVGLMLLQWRKRVARGPVQVPQKKPVQVQGLRRQKSLKYPIRSRRTSVARYLNPLCLLARLRDHYVHMMNTVATSGIVPGGPMGDDSGTHGSTLFCSREFDAESIAQLVELERTSSKLPDSNYRHNLAFARNLSRLNLSTEPALLRSKSTKYSFSDIDRASAYFSNPNPAAGRLNEEPVLTRSKSNSVLDDVFSAQRLRGSRKKLHINPFVDNEWTSAGVASGPPKVLQSNTAGGTDDDFHSIR